MSAEDIQTSQGLPLPGGSVDRRMPPDIQRQLNAPGVRKAVTVQTGGQQDPIVAPPTLNAVPPSINIGTDAIYNTLPANAGNFNYTQTITLTSTTITGGIATNAQIFTTTIQQGRIFYLRDMRVNVTDTRYDFEGTEIDNGIPPQTITLTVFRNTGAEVFNQNIIVEPLDNYNPVFLIAGPGDSVSVAVSFDYSSLPNIPNEVDLITHLRGELLVPNDMPVPYTALKTR
jgi:hypothetical protein